MLIRYKVSKKVEAPKERFWQVISAHTKFDWSFSVKELLAFFLVLPIYLYIISPTVTYSMLRTLADIVAYPRKNAHTHTRTYTHGCAHVNAQTRAQLHALTRKQVQPRRRTQKHTYTRKHTYIYTHAGISTSILTHQKHNAGTPYTTFQRNICT